MWTLVFWTSMLLLAYVYAGYPLLAWLRARLLPKAHRSVPWEPTVSVIVIAHNEADRIGARIGNLLTLDYPQDKLQILIASDGSTDATVARARAFAQAGVVVRAFHLRRGKAAVLNDVVPSASGEIVVLADARQQFDRGAVRALVADFADESVGAVSGELMMMPPVGGSAVGKGVGFYWRYEKFIRRSEGRAGSTVGATGAIYAIRRALFTPIPEDTILDDVLIPLRVIRAGRRVLFEPEARAYDVASSTSRQELVRKIRTIAGTFQLLARELWLFVPGHNPVWLAAMSHKALRLTTPALQVMALVANIELVTRWPYQLLLAGQLVFYAAALIGFVLQQTGRSNVLFNLPYTVCLLSWATVAGFVQWAARRQTATWERAIPGVQGIAHPDSRLARAAFHRSSNRRARA